MKTRRFIEEEVEIKELIICVAPYLGEKQEEKMIDCFREVK